MEGACVSRVDRGDLGGYTPGAASFVVPVVAPMLTGFINPPLYSELPVAGSRKERSLATMAQMLGWRASRLSSWDCPCSS